MLTYSNTVFYPNLTTTEYYIQLYVLNLKAAEAKSAYKEYF